MLDTPHRVRAGGCGVQTKGQGSGLATLHPRQIDREWHAGTGWLLCKADLLLQAHDSIFVIFDTVFVGTHKIVTNGFNREIEMALRFFDHFAFPAFVGIVEPPDLLHERLDVVLGRG